MQLLVLVLNRTEVMPEILSDFMNDGIKGSTVLDCDGSLNYLNNMEDAPPIFGSLRQFLNPGHSHAKLLLVVLSDDKVADAKKIIDRAVGGIDKPNTGIIFTVTLSSVEGLAH
ncbi:MAG: hypothetical protein K6F09_01515 [Clostridiales bacterium]|nr:hypothetical protein [Clostridiales bacterium]